MTVAEFLEFMAGWLEEPKVRRDAATRYDLAMQCRDFATIAVNLETRTPEKAPAPAECASA